MKTLHTSVEIRYLLRQSDAELDKIIRAPKSASVGEKRLELYRRLDAGERVVPIGEPCEGFDPRKGCPGHEIKEELVSFRDVLVKASPDAAPQVSTDRGETWETLKDVGTEEEEPGYYMHDDMRPGGVTFIEGEVSLQLAGPVNDFTGEYRRAMERLESAPTCQPTAESVEAEAYPKTWQEVAEEGERANPYAKRIPLKVFEYEDTPPALYMEMLEQWYVGRQDEHGVHWYNWRPQEAHEAKIVVKIMHNEHVYHVPKVANRVKLKAALRWSFEKFLGRPLAISGKNDIYIIE